ncbi:DUF3231 family protein [Jeotgalibacillus proteolyticus]|uniref:DUF3231 domain-containing protein n=1 Tax=Jeotgalibacillus proteolyticus TaxID=2082395 RepID=A0A2S5G8U6_9BACL|nr:DUF3231 family protein [Jeotgalibacillus proteolyticus]PPA69416.1 hypothetical protein C4B60_16660 [Jeotgalibacillus proteolyticus]
MGILSGNPKVEPMHYGEVFGTWSYLSTAKAGIAKFQTLINHAGDRDLQELIEEAIKLGEQEVEQLETILKENGIGLPPTPPSRPVAKLDEIPTGARFHDVEISASISMDIAAGLVACSQIIGQSIREDIALLFGQFHMQKAALGAKFLRLSKEKGWLVPPPLHQGQ